jgi:hypothetical protein
MDTRDKHTDKMQTKAFFFLLGSHFSYLLSIRSSSLRKISVLFAVLILSCVNLLIISRALIFVEAENYQSIFTLRKKKN